MRNANWKHISLAAMALLLSACTAGGNLTLEPGAVISKKKGAPGLEINQGGKALVVETGKTSTTGVHGWVTIQSMVSTQMTSAGHRMTVTNTQVPH